MEAKKYRTVAAMRRAMEDRLAAERLDLAANDAEQKLIEARIFMILDLLKTVDATGEEEEHDD